MNKCFAKFGVVNSSQTLKQRAAINNIACHNFYSNIRCSTKIVEDTVLDIFLNDLNMRHKQTSEVVQTKAEQNDKSEPHTKPSKSPKKSKQKPHRRPEIPGGQNIESNNTTNSSSSSSLLLNNNSSSPSEPSSKPSIILSKYFTPPPYFKYQSPHSKLEDKSTPEKSSATSKKPYPLSFHHRTVHLNHVPKVASSEPAVTYRLPLESITLDRIEAALGTSGPKPAWSDMEANFKEIEIQRPTLLKKVKEECIPQLAHNLDNVVRRQGVHTVRNLSFPEEYNYTKFLERIYQPSEIQHKKFSPFITTSRDTILAEEALLQNCRYRGSTSSISPMLSAIYQVISNSKPTATKLLPSCRDMNHSFTQTVKKPAAIYLRPDKAAIDKTNQLFYSVDSAGDQPKIQILTELGKSLEKMLITEENEFKKTFVKNNLNPAGEVQEEQDTTSSAEDAYHYMKIGNFLCRSQIDCKSQSIARESNVFDIKTRAISNIRVHLTRYEEFSHTSLRSIYGKLDSYEKEFYDLVRSAFLKYSFQTRIGYMDGVFVGYHNTRKMLGFEYIQTEELDTYVFGSHHMGKQFFDMCMSLFSGILDEIINQIPNPNQCLKIIFHPRRYGPYFLDVFVKPIENDMGWQDPISYVEEAEKQAVSQMEIGDVKLKQPLVADLDDLAELGLSSDEKLEYLQQLYSFRVGFEVYVNGQLQLNYVNFDKDDKVSVRYFVTTRGSLEADPTLEWEYRNLS